MCVCSVLCTTHIHTHMYISQIFPISSLVCISESERIIFTLKLSRMYSAATSRLFVICAWRNQGASPPVLITDRHGHIKYHIIS